MLLLDVFHEQPELSRPPRPQDCRLHRGARPEEDPGVDGRESPEADGREGAGRDGDVPRRVVKEKGEKSHSARLVESDRKAMLMCCQTSGIIWSWKVYKFKLERVFEQTI